MQLSNIHEAKTHLSQLIRRALAGEEIVIGRAGDPLVTLVPYRPPAEERKGGQLKGKIWMASSFDDFDEELQAMFSGPIFPAQ